MPNRNWGAVLTAGGIAFALVLLTASALAGWHYRSEHAEERERAATYAQKERHEEWPAFCIDLPGFSALACLGDAPEPKSEEARAEYDLRAQQDMAEWAFAMFIASCFGVLVTLSGVVYVAITLHETRKMVGQAAKANEAAREANAQFARHSAAELRAYVMPTNVDVYDFEPGKWPRFGFYLSNFGPTPARAVQVWASVRGYVGNPETAKLTSSIGPKRFTSGSASDLGPGQPNINQKIDFPDPLTQQVFDEVKSGKGTFIFWGAVRYRDVFGKRHHTVFCAYIRKIDRNGKAILSPTRRHNWGN